MIESDLELIKIVVSNVLENAVTYAAEGTQVSVTTKCVADGIQLFIGNLIEDLNIGARELARFFDPFYRKDQSRDMKGNHSGIGLSFCREIMDLLEGEITVSQAESEGIVFKIVIPAISIP